MQELSLKGVQQILRSAYLIEERVLDLVNRSLVKLIRSWGRFNKPGGYIKTAKTENSPFFDSDRNFFVSKIVRKQSFLRFRGVFFVFSVLTLLPGCN